MSISIFTIKGHNQSFYNLDNAIHAAKDIVKNKVIEQITMLQNGTPKKQKQPFLMRTCENVNLNIV